jgi:hypothetical protein
MVKEKLELSGATTTNVVETNAPVDEAAVLARMRMLRDLIDPPKPADAPVEPPPRDLAAEYAEALLRRQREQHALGNGGH